MIADEKVRKFLSACDLLSRYGPQTVDIP